MFTDSRASGTKVHNRWLNFNSSTSGPSFIAKYNRIVLHTTQSHACSKESGKTEHSIHGTEASWKLKARPTTACTVSRIWPGRTWRQTSYVAVAGKCVLTGPGQPLCRRLAAIQQSRWLAEVGRQVNWPGRVEGSASLSQMCGLQMLIRNNSRDPHTDARSLFTKIRGRGRSRILQKSVILDRS